MKRYKSILKEMALIDKASFFMQTGKDESIDWKKAEGWDSLKSYYTKIKQLYSKTSKAKTFTEWFQFEINGIYSADWENLDDGTKSVMLRFFKKLDEDENYLK
jgi:hypothetical protein